MQRHAPRGSLEAQPAPAGWTISALNDPKAVYALREDLLDAIQEFLEPSEGTK